MWFKSASVFHFSRKCNFTPETLEETLKEHEFTAVNKRQLSSYGWVPPMCEDSEQLVHATTGYMLIKARREERILPASVIAEHMADRIQALEQKLDRKIKGSEKLEIRDNVVMELTPQAFTRSSYEQILIMPKERLLIVDNVSSKKVDQATSLLRESVEKLPIKPVQTDIEQTPMFTRWLKGTKRIPKELTVGDECVLQDNTDTAGTIRCNKQDLTAEEIKALSTTGKQVTRMAFETESGISFVLDEEFNFHKIKFTDTSTEDTDDQGDLDPAAVFDSNVTLMALEFSRLFPDMIEIFGGLSEDHQDKNPAVRVSKPVPQESVTA